MQCIYLKDKCYSIDNLPSEPSLLIELLDLCHQDDPNFESFTNTIKKDAALTTKIIQVSNSPAYRQWNSSTDIRRMLIILGMSNVKSIAITCAIQQFFANFTTDFTQQVELIWRRALLCANLSEKLANLVGYKETNDAFLAGLLHQVGMLLLLLNRKSDYLPILDRYYTDTEKFHLIEQQHLHINHCELGAALIESWQLDSFIAAAINFQRAPTDELTSAPILLKIVAIASHLSSKNSARNDKINIERAGLLFDLTDEIVLDCVTVAVNKSQKMAEDLGINKQFYTSNNEVDTFDLQSTEDIHNKLSDRIKNISLGKQITNSETTKLSEFTKEIRAYFSTIFNLNQLCFFELDSSHKSLIAVNDLVQKQLEEITIAVDDNSSLLAQAFRTRDCLGIRTDSISIIDQQIIRLINSEAGYFIPIYLGKNQLGVLVLGTSASELPSLQLKQPLLKIIGHEIARKYITLQQNLNNSSEMTLIDFKKVAHEISNPLSIINNYVYLLGKKMAGDHSIQEEINLIRDEIERVGNLLLRTKNPESTINSGNNRVDVNKLLTDLNQLLSSSIYQSKQIKTNLILDDHIPLLNCHRDKLKQILLNIIKNGVEALPTNGEIVITSRDNIFQNNHHFIELTISDNGSGIDTEILANLFQPVTSTKSGHSGLGLAIAHTLIEEIGGTISCYSKSDFGTEFKLLIPRNIAACEVSK